jgi:hypothetical protein
LPLRWSPDQHRDALNNLNLGRANPNNLGQANPNNRDRFRDPNVPGAEARTPAVSSGE